MRQQGGISGDDDDDRTPLGRPAAPLTSLEMAPDRHPTDTQFRSQPEIRLNEHADRIRLAVNLDEARCRARSGLELKARHSGAAADTALLYRPRCGRLDRREDMLVLHMKAIDVVEK